MRLARRSSKSRAKIHREAFILPVSAWGVLALLLLTPSAGQADCEYFRPYPKDYNTCLEREKAERATQQREWLYRQTQRRQQEQQQQLRQQQQQKQEALEREQQKEAEERAFRQRQLDLMSQQMEQQRAYQQRQLEMQQQQLRQQHDLNCNVFGYGNRSYSINCN